MGRKPVTMQLIGGPSTRAATFKQRKSSLFKKAKELSILCGIEVCIAVSKGSDDQAPEIWPSLDVITQKVSQENGRSNGDKKLAQEVAELQFQVQQVEEENLDLLAKIDSISKLPPLIGTEAGKCVVPATVQDTVAYSEPVASLPDTMPDLLDTADDMDMEEFCYGRPVDITEWKGIDDCMAPFLRRFGGGGW
ncbi:MADS-box transcription factor 23 [Carex littledalei]|uniref:MADS-box transcription factor 23 n=1 Tax=Carex littledalei TaxID=544730 RepID=A0A833QKX1_9POAL|nr:MADS-box transcription factor 23 [Carex littledalei]